jgi:hypothetical protein
MFQKPNKKSFTDASVKAISLGLGFKVGDGIAAVMPESVSSYKHWIVAALGFVAAASINPKTTSGLAAQNAALGIAGNGLYNGLTEVISPSVPVQDSSKLSGRFVNALVGHKVDFAEDLNAQTKALGNAWKWEPAVEIGEGNPWERPQAQNREIKIALV